MTAAPVVRWAIKYYAHLSGRGYIDSGTVSWTRRGAWEKFSADWQGIEKKARRMRRKREVVAVRVEIREL